MRGVSKTDRRYRPQRVKGGPFPPTSFSPKNPPWVCCRHRSTAHSSLTVITISDRLRKPELVCSNFYGFMWKKSFSAGFTYSPFVPQARRSPNEPGFPHLHLIRVKNRSHPWEESSATLCSRLWETKRKPRLRVSESLQVERHCNGNNPHRDHRPVQKTEVA